MHEPISVWILDPANLTPYYSLALGGALSSAGAHVRFVTSRFLYDPTLEAPPGVTIDHHYFPSAARWERWGPVARRFYRAVRYPFDHRSLVREISKGKVNKPDVVHLQWSRIPFFDRRLVEKFHRLGVKVVHTVHDVEPLYDSAADRSGLGRVYQACEALVVHTEANRRELLERYPSIKTERVHVIPHGPLQAEQAPNGATRSSARSSLGIPLNARVVGTFGSIKPYKGLDLLVEAMPKVVQRIPDAFLLIGGRPARAADAPDLSILKAQGIAHRADLNFIPNTDAWKYYLAADVFALAYRAITQSGVLLSSMAFGRPSIVTDVGGLPEVVRPGRTGWVVPAENSAALATAIIEALADTGRCEEMGRAARDLAQTRYSWNTIAEQTLDMYDIARR